MRTGPRPNRCEERCGCDSAIERAGGTGLRHAVSRGGTLLQYIRIVSVAKRRVSDTDITSRYEDNQRLGLTICDSKHGKGQLHERECEDTVISTAIGFALLY
jgi:hypothetical protein